MTFSFIIFRKLTAAVFNCAMRAGRAGWTARVGAAVMVFNRMSFGRRASRALAVSAAAIAVAGCAQIKEKVGDWMPSSAADDSSYAESAQTDRTVRTVVEFETLSAGAYGVVDRRGVWVIDNEAEWKEWLARSDAFGGQAPVVDFSRDMLVVATMGERRTGGYAIRIIEIIETADALEAHIEAKSPAAGGIVTQALTHPYHIIKLPRSSKPLTPIPQP